MNSESRDPGDIESLSDERSNAGVAGVTIVWADNNGIPRSRTVPVGQLAEVATRGVGITALFAVFDSHDQITFAHEHLSTPCGDVRLVPVLERLRPLAGQPALAWAPDASSQPTGQIGRTTSEPRSKRR